MSTKQTTVSSSTEPQAHEVIEVGADALPVYCPGPQAPAWSMHPRVFLDVTRSGSASCPYCGAVYRLQAGAVVPHHH